MIIFLTGNEPYSIDYYKKKYQNDLQMKEFNFYKTTVFDVSTFNICWTSPFIDDVKVVLLEKESSNDDDLLIEYINNPNPSCNLIITVRELDKRSKFYKLVKSKNHIQECNKLSEKELHAFILRIIKQSASSIKVDAFERLIQRLNYSSDNLNLYDVEIIVKQLTYLSNSITVEDIDIMVEESCSDNIFKLISYLANGEISKMFRLLDSLLLDESAIHLLLILLRSYRLIYKMSLLHYDAESYKKVGITSYQIRDLQKLDSKCVSLSLSSIENSIKNIKKGMNARTLIRLCMCQLASFIN